MPTIDVILDGDGAWPDLRGLRVFQADSDWRLAALEHGMSSGAPSIALRLTVADAELDREFPVIAETSLAAWIAATCALRGRFPEAFAGTPLEEAGR
jgi:hypothetical protein